MPHHAAWTVFLSNELRQSVGMLPHATWSREVVLGLRCLWLTCLAGGLAEKLTVRWHPVACTQVCIA